MEGETLARALLRFESGVVAGFDALHGGAHMGGGDEFRVTGTLGEVLIERGAGGRVVLFDKEYPAGHIIMTKDEGRADAFGYELADFANAVLDGAPLAAGPEHSLGELRIALAIYRSAASRQWERVWS
jgi:predicted dehydrogenase